MEETDPFPVCLLLRQTSTCGGKYTANIDTSSLYVYSEVNHLQNRRLIL